MSRNLPTVVLFFLAAISILYLFHYFIYFSVVHLLGVVAARRKLALGVALFLLPTSFVVSSILVHRWMGLWTRWFYFFSGLWLGIGLSLMCCLALAWAGWGAARLFAHAPGRVVFGWAALALAGAYSAYGVWNAYHLRTREITVHIRNLPAAWQGKTVVQISDVHLGYIRGEEFLREIVARANARQPAAVFITGDLFDGSDGRLEELVAPLGRLQAPQGIYFVTGNHEVYLGVERAAAALRKTPVRILSDERVEVEGLQIVGVSYPRRGFSKDLASVLGHLPGFNRDAPSILLYHNPSQVEAARAAGVGLQLAGHTHQGQIFPMHFITWLIYRKYYRGLHVEGDYTIYTSSGAGTWGPALRTGNHPEIVAIRLE